MGKSRTRCVVLPAGAMKKASGKGEIVIPDPPPVEKTKLFVRLRSEGRWNEAQEFKIAIQRYLKKRGVVGALAEAHAWAEVERNFPPLASGGGEGKDGSGKAEGAEKGRVAAEVVSSPKASAGGGDQPSTKAAANPRLSKGAKVSGNAAAKESVEKLWEKGDEELVAPVSIDMKVPYEWGELPASAELTAEVLWVHQNRLVVVQRQRTGVIRFNLRNAHGPAPSHGALSWLEFAVSNPTKFMSDVLPRALKGSDEEGEGIERERRAVEEVKKVLDQYRDRRKREREG